MLAWFILRFRLIILKCWLTTQKIDRHTDVKTPPKPFILPKQQLITKNNSTQASKEHHLHSNRRITHHQTTPSHKPSNHPHCRITSSYHTVESPSKATVEGHRRRPPSKATVEAHRWSPPLKPTVEAHRRSLLMKPTVEAHRWTTQSKPTVEANHRTTLSNHTTASHHRITPLHHTLE